MPNSSHFTDVISNLYLPSTIKSAPNTPANVTFSESGIAWSFDVHKYKKTSYASLPEQTLNTKVFPPPFWVKSNPWNADFSKGYTKDNLPDFSQMERFWVWMRTSGLPTMRKPWGRRDEDVPKGTYVLNITYSTYQKFFLLHCVINCLITMIYNNCKNHLDFDPNLYGGTKGIVISNMSILGGKNYFLGAAYILLGLIYWISGALFLMRHMVKPRYVFSLFYFAISFVGDICNYYSSFNVSNLSSWLYQKTRRLHLPILGQQKEGRKRRWGRFFRTKRRVQ
jgi:hypothetical protein